MMTPEDPTTPAPEAGGASTATAAELAAARILTLLDASRHSLAALAAAVELAAGQRAELIGLFIEDQDLLYSTAFPFAGEIGAYSGICRGLSRSQLERRFADQAVRARQALDQAVSGRQLVHSFRVRRGRIVNETLACAGPGDLLVLGKAGLSLQWGLRLGSTSQALLLEAPCTVIVWDERQPLLRGPIRVLVDAEGIPDDMTGAIPPMLEGQFEEIEPLTRSQLSGLLRLASTGEGGALLLTRPQLLALSADEPELLARLPVPIIVVP